MNTEPANTPIITLRKPEGIVTIERLTPGKNRISVEAFDKGTYIEIPVYETSYPVELIAKMLEIKGIAWLCDEIARDESPDYVQQSLAYGLLRYLGREEFRDKRLLDFGCGSGSSTMILSRMFPETDIVGIELDDRLLSVARARAEFYGCTRVRFMTSPASDQLPPDIGEFDFISLSAVYEHFLPLERTTLLPRIWNLLKPGGILFLNQTPYRFSLFEAHTSGLPFINFMPDRMALAYTRRFSKRNLQNFSWEDLLRMGIRGASVKEILHILDGCPHKPILLEPVFSYEKPKRIELHNSRNLKTQFIDFVRRHPLLLEIIRKIRYHDLFLAIKKNGLSSSPIG